MKSRAFDVLGNIAVVNFPRKFPQKEKKKFAEGLLKKQKSIKTILEKSGKVKGRLRKISTKYLAGEKTKEVLYRENGCVFRFNIDTTYFSPRLSNERKEISQMIKKGENVLVMFAGVAPFSIVIAKNSKAGKVFSNEINREANKYTKLNIELNNLKDKIELVSGDIRKVVKKLSKSAPPTTPKLPAHLRSQISKKFINDKTSLSLRLQQASGFLLTTSKSSSVLTRDNLPKFDVIVMPRPKLKETFLKEAFMLSKRGTRIFYYDFCRSSEENLIVEKIKKEARKYKKKIKILKIKKAGEIAPYKIRVRVDFVVL